MSLLYELIGRVVVLVVRRRYGRQIQAAGVVAGALAVAGGLIGAYLLASREVEEG